MAADASFGRVCKNSVEYGVLVMLVFFMLALVMLKLFLISLWFGILKITCIAYF